VTEKTGHLVGILDVSQKEDLMITCKSGVTIRMPVAGISEQGRATQGVKLIRLDGNDAIAAITNLDEHPENGTIPVESLDAASPEENTDATNSEGSESSGQEIL